MKIKALSNYNGDLSTRFGDCILIYKSPSLVVYDCGHKEHAEEVERLLLSNPEISQIHVVISHNDSDHTDGVIGLLDFFNSEGYSVTLYSSLYLKSAEKVLEILDDERRTLPATKQRILELFDNIKKIVEKAQQYKFKVKDAIKGTAVSSCSIVGPTEDEFVEVIAYAIENGNGAQIDGETVMNAASLQLKCKLENAQTIILCGDATPSYMHVLEDYDIIQLPHHGKLDSAKSVFDKIDELSDSYSKTYLVSDNTGSGKTSGGSDDLVQYMIEECYDPALNTKTGVVHIPQIGCVNVRRDSKEVRLGAVDCRRGSCN